MKQVLIIFLVSISLLGFSQNTNLKADTLVVDSCAISFIDSVAIKKRLAIKYKPIIDVSEDYTESELISNPKKNNANPWWLLLLLIVSVVFLVIMRLVYSKDLYDMYRGLFNINLAQQYYRERELSISMSNIILNVLIVISIALYLSLIVNYFNVKPFSWDIVFLYSILLISILYTIKYIYIEIVSVVFPITDTIQFYGFNFFVNRRLLAIGLIPFNLLIAYSNGLTETIFVYLSLVFVLLMLLLGVFRGVVIGQKYFFAEKFHFILYICTLEIAPILVLVKWLIEF